MDSPEHRRNRKRHLRPPPPPPHLYFLSLPSHYFLFVRSFILFLLFISLVSFFSHRIPITPSFHPVLVVSSLSLLSSSPLDLFQNYSNCNVLLKIEDRVLFPDHVLLLVSNKKRNTSIIIQEIEELDCVYSHILLDKFSGTTNNSDFEGRENVKRAVLLVDELDEFRLIVRCPLPPVNYSAAVNLGGRGGDGLWKSNQTIHSWDNVAYEAVLDGETAVVFVKGLNLRRNRKSDASQLSCYFGLGNLEKDGIFSRKTKAITAAQEIVRCLLPQSMRKNPNSAEGIRVTIGVAPHFHAGAHEHVLVPSVAKVFNSKPRERKKNKRKYELCACTMVWNQAASLREWIIYHAWLGVERWFIYDNNSDDGIKEVIEELEVQDYNVSRHVWPWIKTQEAGFSHCALRARDECNWVSFMDVDEFFYFPFRGFRSRRRFRKLGFPVLPRRKPLRALVANFSSSATVAEIRTACHSFGPSGLSSPPSQGVTVGYTCRLQSPERHKSIVRPDALDLSLLNVVHHFHLRKGFKYLNLPQGIAVINHYKYQVWESFKAKFFRRVATYVADWQENQNEGSKDRAPGLGTEPIEPPNWQLQFCEIWDTGLRDFALANLANPSTGLLPWERSPR